MRTIKDYGLLFLKGIGMGSADAVPGVSGGTIAFITGIYEELIQSIRSVDAQAIRLLLSFKIQALWKHVNANFLIVLLAGIAVAIVTLSKAILYFLENYPEVLWAFFFGLIVASTWVVAKKINRWEIFTIIALIVGTALGYLVTRFSAAETPETTWFIFLSGAIAICAMILPGISGSFILVLLGKYKFIFGAIEQRDFLTILTFLSGCLVGILAFSHFINYMLKRYYNSTVAFLMGIMIGSLNKVWPWKETLTTYVDRHGVTKPELQRNILPTEYLEITGQEPYLIYATLAAIAGFALVYIFDRLAPGTSEG